jgi:pyruvate dehydrogenase E2 component (dihydrolipoamide acetyltransferase)
LSSSDIVMPQLGLTMTEGRVVTWHVAVGDSVECGQVVATIESEKTQEDVVAEADGVLEAIVTPEGEVAAIGAPIGRLRVSTP